MLKIDRTDHRELNFEDDKIEYSPDEIKSLVNTIESANRLTYSSTKIISAFGLVGQYIDYYVKFNEVIMVHVVFIGFVRFLEGYYIIVINKRRKVAVIGHHSIYKIQDTNMIYIPNDIVRTVHPDEQRYVKMFQSIDLSSNFYFR